MKFQANSSTTVADLSGGLAGYGKRPTGKTARSLRWGAIAASAGLLILAIPAVSSAATTVYLGSAGYFSILAETGISTTGSTHVVGNMGVSPITSTAITGFNLAQTTPTWSSSPLVTRAVYAADYAAPTPANLTLAISAMQNAYANAAGRISPNYTNLGTGNIGGQTLKAGLYKWTTGVTIPANVTISGGPNAIWIFQVAGTLNVSSGQKVLLAGGAQDKNIFWVVAGVTTLGTTSVLRGTVLDKTGIIMKTGASLYGRALAQTAVTLDATLVTP